MRTKFLLRRSAALAAALAMTAGLASAAGAAGGTAAYAELPSNAERPTRTVLLSTGQGELINLPTAVSNVWTSNPSVADVYVSNPRQIHLFGKDAGEATVFATTASGAVVYSANLRVSQNITSVDQALAAAMPDAHLTVTNVGQLAVLSGTVASPEDAATAELLVKTLLNPGQKVTGDEALKIGVINRLRTATPLQVNLQVRIAEVSRSFIRDIGVSVTSVDSSNGFRFGIGQGRTEGIPQFNPSFIDPATGLRVYPPVGVGRTSGPDGGNVVTNIANGTTLGLFGRLLGLDLGAALDLGETVGLVTTLSNPNLTALSGETADFLAGGEFPIPISQGLGSTSIEYRKYGVSLAYTPTVLANGRISLRVRPEVSELSAQGAVVINGFQIPALTIRRAETTVELGSGQSFMIAGLMSNNAQNNLKKAPGIGDIPILGSLFRSTNFRKGETELVIVVTPYLVNPVDANDIKLPTDGFQSPNDIQRLIGNMENDGKSGAQRPVPRAAGDAPVSGPNVGALDPSAATPAMLADPKKSRRARKDRQAAAAAAPGFSLK
ncbi:MAG TPA: type II and III secretion system protein family protein [Novosphingobium sp.]|nr:type II and III secretion system protein family protein [Novosphingobium sp.]